MKKIALAFGAFCFAGTAFAAADLAISIQAPVQIDVNSPMNIDLRVANIGNKRVSSASAQVVLPVGVQVGVLPSGCTLSVRTVQCSLGSIQAGRQVSKSIAAASPLRAGSYLISSSTSGNAAENSLSNNSASLTLTANAEIEIVPTQMVHVRVCAGSGPLNWKRDCAHIPSSHIESDCSLEDFGVIGSIEAEYAGSYHQNFGLNSIQAQFSVVSSGDVEAAFTGTAVSENCFEGTISYPQSPQWYGAFEMCLSN
jgi:hypothetical protein